MPRQRGGGARPSAPSRPQAAAPPRPAPQRQQQQRPYSSAPAAQQQQQQAQAQGRSPGLFGQMASTAAGVAVGSSIGHAIGGFFGGGSSSSSTSEGADQTAYSQPIESYVQPGQQQQAMDGSLYGANVNATAHQQQQAYGQQAGPCANDIRSFTTCMEQNRGDLNVCGWYLEQLKACQAAAARY